MRRSRRRSLWDLKAVYMIRSAILGVIVMLLCLMGFSVIMTHFSAPGPMVSMMANLALCAGCGAAGYTAAKKRRKNGIITGFYCGAIIYCAVYFLGVIILGRFVTMSAFTRLIMAAVCSSIGGILGVNTKIRRPPP